MSSLDFSINPPKIEIVAAPGATFTQTYQITNNSDSDIFLFPSIERWQPAGNQGLVEYLSTSDPNLTFSFSNTDLKLNQTFRLGPLQSRQIVLKVSLHPQIPQTDTYHTLFFTQIYPSSLTSDTNQSQVAGKIGSHLILTVSSIEDTSSPLSFSGFVTSPQIKDILFTPINFSALIANDSSHFQTFSGKITISKQNLLVKEITIPPTTVLSHHDRQLVCTPDCQYRPPFWPGIYTATLSLNNQTPITTAFIILPLSGLIFIVICLTIVFFLFRIKKK